MVHRQKYELSFENFLILIQNMKSACRKPLCSVSFFMFQFSQQVKAVSATNKTEHFSCNTQIYIIFTSISFNTIIVSIVCDQYHVLCMHIYADNYIKLRQKVFSSLWKTCFKLICSIPQFAALCYFLICKNLWFDFRHSELETISISC